MMSLVQIGQRSPRPRNVIVVMVLGGVLLGSLVPQPGMAQPVYTIERLGGGYVAYGTPYGAVQPGSTQKGTLEGATLQTIPEQELFKLRRAQEFADDGDYRSAIALWQSVLDEAGEQLMTRDQWKYRSARREYSRYSTVAQEIERILAELPQRGLETYRLKADGEARSVLANYDRHDRSGALSEVVRRFFLSSVGDDAAFELACLKLDQYEFTGASRLLSKVLSQHPDSSIPREEILLRLAVAGARIGDPQAVADALAELQPTASTGGDGRTAIVKQHVQQIQAGKADFIATADGWPMRFGNAARDGLMPPLSDSATSQPLSESWIQDFELTGGGNVFSATASAAFGGLGGPIGGLAVPVDVLGGARFLPSVRVRRGATPAPPQKLDRKSMIQRWQQSDWLPSGELLIQGGRVYFKAGDRLICCHADTGKMEWMGRQNQFEMDAVTRRAAQFNFAAVHTQPRSTAEVQLFGDRVHQSMTVDGRTLFNIEGHLSYLGMRPPTAPQQVTPRHHQVSAPARTRHNWLAAYDSITGKLKWHRAAREDASHSKFEVGFMAAPVPGGKLVYVPINDSGSLWLMALDPDDGHTVWKSFLCDEPVGGCSPWATVGVAYAGGDVYVGTGAGIVAALDAISGTLRWVLRYERTGFQNNQMTPYGLSQQARVSGWHEDVVVPEGRALVVMASDSDILFAVDRRTGELLWDSPRGEQPRASEYYLGARGHRVFVAGKKIVRAYDIAGGRLLWEQHIDNSYGRGMVTADSIYLPVQKSVMRLDPADGTIQSQAAFVSPTREPAGNLYSDGHRLLVVGMSRVFALTHLQERLNLLADRIAKGDSDALLTRMRLRAEQSDVPGACADLKAAYELVRQHTGPVAASKVLYDALPEVSLPSKAPRFVLQMLAQAEADCRASSLEAAKHKAIAGGRDSLLYSTLHTIDSDNIADAAADVLAVASLCVTDNLLAVADRAMQATSHAQDVDILKKALTDRNELVRTMAVAGITAALPEDASVELEQVLNEDASEKVRLAAALALANVGERNVLQVLGDLLSSGRRERTSWFCPRLARSDRSAFSVFASRHAGIRRRGQLADLDCQPRRNGRVELSDSRAQSTVGPDAGV